MVPLPDNGRALYIWGTGQVGRDARQRLSGRNLRGFIDSAPSRWGTTVDGLSVSSPASVLSGPGRSFVVVASMYEHQIAADLTAAGWRPGADFAGVAAVAGGTDEDPEAVFSRIFERNAWQDDVSVSGGGSSLAATHRVRDALPSLFRRHGVRSVLDAPCGDVNWMATLLPALEAYTGVDIVAALIERNRTRFGSARATFLRRDVTVDALPGADLVICRDCLVHLPTTLAVQALRSLARTTSTYLLATTFPESGLNGDILTGAWRAVNLQRAPFALPEPLELIAEDATGPDGCFGDKALGLWRMDDVRAALA